MHGMRRAWRIVGIGFLVSTVWIAGCMLFQQEVVVDIAASETDGVTPLIVEFAPVVAGDIEACYWDFGDGETSNEIHPVHVYRTAGTYDVFLRVALVNGSQGTVEKRGLIDVALIARKDLLTDLYWLNANNGTIHRGDRAGYQEETIVSYIYRGGDLAVGGGYVFWIAEDAIYRANFDGTDKKAIVTGQEGLASVTVNGAMNTIYWACWPSPPYLSAQWNGSLKSANLGGGTRWLVQEYDNPAAPYTWVVRSDSGSPILFRYFDDDNLAYPVRLSPRGASDGRLESVIFPTPTTHAVNQIVTSMDGIVTMALDAGNDFARYIYWIAGSAIRRCRVNGSDATTLLRNLDNPRGVAADIIEGKMYWSDAKGIHRAELDGTGAELIYPGVHADVLVIQE